MEKINIEELEKDLKNLQDDAKFFKECVDILERIETIKGEV